MLTYFSCRADASSGVKRKEFRYLDGARVAAGESPEGATMVLQFNDGTMHRLRCDDGDDRISRQVSAEAGSAERSVPMLGQLRGHYCCSTNHLAKLKPFQMLAPPCVMVQSDRPCNRRFYSRAVYSGHQLMFFYLYFWFWTNVMRLYYYALLHFPVFGYCYSILVNCNP